MNIICGFPYEYIFRHKDILVSLDLSRTFETGTIFICYIIVNIYRRGTHMSNANKGRWYRFNDTIIEEFDMTDAALEAECFGGSYKAKVYDTCKPITFPAVVYIVWNEVNDV